MLENKAITADKIRIAKEMVWHFIRDKKPDNEDTPLAFHLWLQILENKI